MHRSRSISSHCRRLRCLLGIAVLAGAAVSVGAFAAGAPAKPISSCVACHTDVEKLKAEAALVPAPPASALQAGKG